MTVPTTRLVGLAGIAVLALAALVMGVLTAVSPGQRTYTAELEHTAGLRVGEEVQVAGVGVGEVSSIALGEEAVEVRFTVDRDVRLGTRTRAAVEVATLLGSHVLQVSPAGSGQLADDRISLAATSVPYNLQDVVEGTQRTVGAIDEDRVADALAVVAEVLERTPEETSAALEGVAELTAVAARRSGDLRRLLAASNEVSGLLARDKESILGLLEQSTLVLEELTSRREVIDALLRDARAMGEQVTALLRENEDDLRPLMRDLSVALDSLEDSREDVVAAMGGLATMSRYVANASGNGPWLDANVPIAVNDNLTCVGGASRCQ